MNFRLLFLLAFLFFWSCGESPEKDTTNISSIFSTTAPSHLFFKNMRSSYYEQSQQPNTRVDLYRLRKLSAPSNQPLIYPIIADNWMKDEAYLLVQTNEYEGGFSSPLKIFWKNGNEKGMIEMKSPPNFDHQYEFALALNDLLKKDYNLEIENEQGERASIFEKYDQKSGFMTTVRDFQKLVELD